ncbi:hypothetical protein LCGC14_0781770 [marine sediment metagenome]|uniref:Uncharacterized protein n=1 Tax=marine sediment metagenome TaxID=412755 RepID=A0A0F9PVH1_9ZZZZ
MTIFETVGLVIAGIISIIFVVLFLSRFWSKKQIESVSKTRYVVVHDGCGGIVGELEGGGGIQWLCTKCKKLWEFFEERTDVWLFVPKRQITGSNVGDTAVGQGHVHGPGWGGVRFKDGSVGFPE